MDTSLLPDRIRSKIAPAADGCWLWVAGRTGSGYGAVKVNKRQTLAHRTVYQLLVGPIPDGLEIDHLCRVRHCVNPAHLEPVPHRENTLRSPDAPAAQNARKTHCPQGHEYTPENTRIKRRKRHCIACEKVYDHSRIDRRRERRHAKERAERGLPA